MGVVTVHGALLKKDPEKYKKILDLEKKPEDEGLSKKLEKANKEIYELKEVLKERDKAIEFFEKEVEKLEKELRKKK